MYDSKYVFHFKYDTYFYLVQQKHVGKNSQGYLLSLSQPREDHIKGEHYIVLGNAMFTTFSEQSNILLKQPYAYYLCPKIFVNYFLEFFR